jgi:membrane protease YdiL (CAAX protease family)
MLLAGLLFYLLMFALGAGIAAWQGHLRSWIDPATLGPDVLLGAGIGVVVVVLSRMAVAIPVMRRVSLELGEALQGLRPSQLPWLAVCSGLAEEALFRGTSPPRFGAALVVATVIFAAIHIGRGWRFLWWTAFALVVGILLATLYVWRGNLVAPVMVHMTVNMFNLPYLHRLFREAQR